MNRFACLLHFHKFSFSFAQLKSGMPRVSPGCNAAFAIARHFEARDRLLQIERQARQVMTCFRRLLRAHGRFFDQMRDLLHASAHLLRRARLLRRCSGDVHDHFPDLLRHANNLLQRRARFSRGRDAFVGVTCFAVHGLDR